MRTFEVKEEEEIVCSTSIPSGTIAIAVYGFADSAKGNLVIKTDDAALVWLTGTIAGHVSSTSHKRKVKIIKESEVITFKNN